ncbi:hemerythrin domain-containing protein [uncultured Nevskia sp.]|uniref:hemerythrin domain-containing protein n=1 Tax=uncultured Nevskia sp. TaxID=228950 RepID=UPI0025D8D506|nr:hemerythrin domain-containing protein [uncultured Nevskia sp.]
MSIIDKVVAAVTPPESDHARAKARRKAQQQAEPDTWLAMVLKHHEQIEAAFDAVEKAKSLEQRRATQKWLAVILTGHAIAEEVTLYPALASHGEKTRTELAYQEQSAAKGETAALEELDPLSDDYNDKLAHIRGAVAHHMYEEEGTWFLKLQEKASPETIARLTRRYEEEFNRYVGGDSSASVIKAFKSELDAETAAR